MIHLDEGDIMWLVDAVSADRGVRPPRVEFEYSITAWANHRKGSLIFPTLAFLRTHQAIDTDEELKLLVLHEMAHYIMGPKPGHSPEYYATLFGLCSDFGVDLEFALKDEASYKPRNAPKGFKMWLERVPE